MIYILIKTFEKVNGKKKTKWVPAEMREIWTFRRPRALVDVDPLGGVKGVLLGYIPARGRCKTGPRACSLLGRLVERG
jgi:hypothetical protein